MSVEFSRLLGAQAGRHQRALRRYISAHTRGVKKTCSTEMGDYTKNKQISCNNEGKKKKMKPETKSKEKTINVNSSCSAVLLAAWD